MRTTTGRGLATLHPRAVDRPWPPRAALVTGATGGIGSALAQQLRALGTRVLAVGRDSAALDTLTAVGCEAHHADLSSAEGALSLAEEVRRACPQLDLLVLAAGIGAAGRFVDLPVDQLVNVLAVDLLAPLVLLRALLPAMLEHGSGRVLAVGSVAGALAVNEEAVYSAAKAGLATFAAALRSELRGTGVSVTLAVPGVVDTDFFVRRGRPYARERPAPLPPAEVARRMLDATRQGRSEVWTPRWLAGVARLRGVAPNLYHRLADATGGTS